MAGARKFTLDYLDCNQLFALTKEDAEISGVPYVMDADLKEVKKMLE